MQVKRKHFLAELLVIPQTQVELIQTAYSTNTMSLVESAAGYEVESHGRWSNTKRSVDALSESENEEEKDEKAHKRSGEKIEITQEGSLLDEC